MAYKGEQRTVRVRSSGSIIGSWAATGGSMPTVLNDDVDTTYILGPGKDLASYGSYARLFMAAITLASNERIVQYRPRVKMKVNDSGGSTRKSAIYIQIREQGSLSNPAHPANLYSYIPTITPAKEYAGTWRSRSPRGKELTTTEINKTIVQGIDRTPTTFTSGQRIRMTEAYLDYIVNRRPTLTSLDVLEEDITTSPLVTYIWNDLDGDVQIKHQIKVFTDAQATTPGFNPDYTQPIYQSGIVNTAVSEHRIQANLTQGVAYRAYVRAAQSVGDLGDWWTVWSYVAFTIVLTAPPSPELLLAEYDPVRDRAAIVIRGRLNELLAQDSSWEGSGVGNWTGLTNCTLSNVTTWAAHGTHSLQITATAAGNVEASTLLFAASPGRKYHYRVTARANTTVRLCTAVIHWFDGDFNFIGLNGSTAANDSTSVDTTYTMEAVAPANARWKRITFFIENAAAGEAHRIDKADIGPGDLVAYNEGGHSGIGQYEIQYADMARNGNIVHPNVSSGGGFYENTDGWYPRNATDVISVSQEVPAYSGDWCIRWVPMSTSSILDVGSRVNAIDPYVWAVKPGVTYEHSVRLRPYHSTFLTRVRFVYLDATGAEVGAADSGDLTVTTGWTEVAPADSAAPVAAVLCRMEVQNRSGDVEVPLFVDNVQFGEAPFTTSGDTPGQGELLAWRPWRRSWDPTTGDFSAFLLNADIVAAQEATPYDHEVPPDKLRLYRARAVIIIADVEIASAWSVILPISTDLSVNWLKYPWEPSWNLRPRVNGMNPLRKSKDLRRGIHDVVGRRTPVVLSSTPSSDRFSLEFVVESEGDWNKLEQMLDTDGPFLLKTPSRQWWFQPEGTLEERDYTVGQPDESYYRAAALTIREVATP